MLTQAIIKEVYEKLEEIQLKRDMNIVIDQLPEIKDVTILLDLVCIYDNCNLIYSERIGDFKRAYPKSQLRSV